MITEQEEAGRHLANIALIPMLERTERVEVKTLHVELLGVTPSNSGFS